MVDLLTLFSGLWNNTSELVEKNLMYIFIVLGLGLSFIMINLVVYFFKKCSKVCDGIFGFMKIVGNLPVIDMTISF